jgi:hypothetical protein
MVATVVAVVMLIAGCQSTNPQGPTPIPSITLTPLPTRTATPEGVVEPTLRPIITATGLGPTPAPVVELPTIAPTPGPICSAAKAGDTVASLLTRAGYADFSPWADFCTLNGMASGCTNIVAGKEYCVPRQTATPTPPGYEMTAAAQFTALGNLVGPQNRPTAMYTVVEGDNIMVVQIKTGASLRELCELNNPSPINCGPCQIDKPIGQQGCKPVLVLGAQIKIYGPTPTPTITPTLTGSETATPTPPYPKPRIVAPINGETVIGPVQLVWVTASLLQPDERYLVLMTDMTSGKSYEFESDSTSLRLPENIQPVDGKPHTINWQVGVARQNEEGAYIQVGNPSVIYTFIWQSHP